MPAEKTDQPVRSWWSRRRGSQMRQTIFATLVMLVTLDGTGMAWETAADRFYEQLRQLEGEWEGTFQWSGGRTESGPVRATYSLTAGGHAVIEQLFMGGAVPSMSSIYHIHADELRMTHYCISRTQPRLKATRIDEADRTAEFDVIDVTGTDPQGRPHVRRFQDPNDRSGSPQNLVHLYRRNIVQGRDRRNHVATSQEDVEQLTTR